MPDLAEQSAPPVRDPSEVSLKRIVIDTVAPPDARLACYASPNSGDWYFEADGTLRITVTAPDLSDPEALLVAVHELVEALLCARDGVTAAQVDAFDQRFERDGEHLQDEEPGDHPESPYRDQHRRACLIEFLLADWLKVRPYGTIR